MRERREISPDELSAWLRAEQVADDAEAENRLRVLFSALAEPAPGAGFTNRVLGRIAEREAVAPTARRRWQLLPLAAALLLAAAGFGWVLAGAGTSGLAAVAALTGRGLASAGEWAGQMFRFWAALAAALEPLAGALARPWLFAMAAALVALSSLALVSLTRWVEREKGVVYALSSS